jgi:hypothetical protein
MEYYERVNDLLGVIANPKQPHDQELTELIQLFSTESARELYLILAEWIALRRRFTASLFLTLCPIFHLQIVRLRGSSPLIVRDLIETLYQKLSLYKPEEIAQIHSFFLSKEDESVNPAFHLFQALISPELSQSKSEIVLTIFFGDSPEVTDDLYHTFWGSPISSQLAFARCAIWSAKRMKRLGLERLSLLLLNSAMPALQRDGVLIAIRIENPSAPKDLFRAIVSRGPFMPTMESARGAWQSACAILDSLNEEDRFHLIREQLESGELPEAARSALTHRAMQEITRQQQGIFRSPFAANFVPLALESSFVSSPVGKTEAVLTALNFIQFMLLLDRREHCFRLFGNPEIMDKLEDTLEKMGEALKKAGKENEKPKEEILREMKKVHMGKEFAEVDVDVVIQQTELSICRIKFALDSVRSVIDGK